MGKSKERKNSTSCIKIVIISVVIGYIIASCIAIAIASLIQSETFSEDMMGSLVTFAVFIGAGIAAIIGAKRNGSRTLFVGFLTGVIMAAVHLIICMIGGEGGAPTSSTLMIMGGCVVGGILGGGLSVRRKRKHRT